MNFAREMVVQLVSKMVNFVSFIHGKKTGYNWLRVKPWEIMLIRNELGNESYDL